MKIPYRTRRTLVRVLIVLAVIALALLLIWACWLLWLGRYVVYTPEGVRFDFDKTTMEIQGQPALPPAEQETVSIYYNEGENAINVSTELTQISGYYISSEDLKDVDALRSQIQAMEKEMAVMVEVKNAYGEFNYSTAVGEYFNSSVDQSAVDGFIKQLTKGSRYTIAKVTAFQDYSYGLNNVDEGLFSTGGAYLWRDDLGCYWLSPSSEQVISYLAQIAAELKGLGFDEVVFDQFLFPDSEGYRFSGDRQESLSAAANTLVGTCATNSFAVSFVSRATFQLPEGRSRLYLQNVEAGNVASVAGNVTVPDKAINLVFLTEVHDTRFDVYSVLRPITAMK